MNIGFYNVLSHLISGFLVYLVGLYFFNIDSNLFSPLVATAIAYILGYFINTISAWTEFILNWTWGGRPSDQLLEGEKCGRIKFAEQEKVLKLLQSKLGNKKASTEDLFKVAIRIANNEGRIPEMNGQYAFSRSILVSILISLIILGVEYYQAIEFWIISIVLILASWYRAKERGYYYAQEVLGVALSKVEKK